MHNVSTNQLRRVSSCSAYPEHIRQIAAELEAARQTISAARRMLCSIVVRHDRPESSERVDLRLALKRYDAVRATLAGAQKGA